MRRKITISLVIFLMIFLLLPMQVFASGIGKIQVTSAKYGATYKAYRVFDVTTNNQVSNYYWVQCRYCNKVYCGDDAYTLLDNHKKSFIGINNEHAGKTYYHDRKTVTITPIYNNANYYIFRDSLWYKKVKAYAALENSGLILHKYEKNTYTNSAGEEKNEYDFYVVEFDFTKFDGVKFEQYLYANIPSNAEFISKTNGSASTVTFDNLDLGLYLVTGQYPGTPSKALVGAEDVLNSTTVKYQDKNSITYTSKVNVYYKDEQGNDLASSTSTSDKVGTKYTTTAKNITGYQLKTTPSNANGTYAYTDTNVTYVYELKDTTITVRYVDDFGTEIHTPTTLIKKYNTTYTTTYLSIAGYKLKSSPYNASGTVPLNNTTVTYTYTIDETQTKTTNVFVQD